jgi:glycerol-3-phosphate dehydrogenase (NAD(P)+)
MIAVLGAGSWGTALAWRLGANAHPVTLWGRSQTAMASLQRTRVNADYLPDARLPEPVTATADIGDLLGAREVIIAAPSHAFDEMLDTVAHVMEPVGVAWATKGFASGSGRLLHEVAQERLGATMPLAAISGPTFAAEVARDLPSAITIAASSEVFSARLQRLFHAPTFRAYTSDDLVGVQIGGALKNVLAIAVGISDGLGFGANAKAALIARGLAELMRVGAAYGASTETLMGLSGVGDLVLTCTDDQSRNRRFGLLLGAGASPAQAREQLGVLVEGAVCAGEIERQAQQRGLDLPIIGRVADVLAERMTALDAVHLLLERDSGPESGH